MEKDVRIGVAGCGGIATAQHIPNYFKIHGVKLVAVADVIEERARSTAEKFGAEAWYTDYKQLLDRDDVDGVSVATPPKWHAEITVYAAKAGKHVLCEKPLARNVKEADDMVEAARKAGTKLMTGYQSRFSWSSKKIKQLVDEGVIGQPYEICSIGGRTWGPGKAWFYDKEIAGGGIGMDGVVYTTHMWQHYLGRVKSVFAQCDTLVPMREVTDATEPRWEGGKRVLGKIRVQVEDAMSLHLKFVNGAVGLLYTSWVTSVSGHGYSEIDGSDGCIVTGGGRGGLAVYTKKEMPGLMKGWHHLQGPRTEEDLYFERIKHFVECIRYNREPIVTGEDGRDAVEVIQAAYISAEKGRVVKLPLPRK